jgi:hypothetical protein
MAGIGTPGKIVDREVIEYRNAWAASAPDSKGTPAINKTLAPAQKRKQQTKSRPARRAVNLSVAGRSGP